MITTTYFGVNVTLAQKEALGREAARQGITRNALIRDLANQILARERREGLGPIT